VRYVLCTAAFLFSISVCANAQPFHRENRFDPLDLRNLPPPPTDADLDRAQRPPERPTGLEEMAGRLGFTDGHADICSSDGAVSCTVDKQGARLYVRW
jgi:hypothetical protein